jgi:hypothetical protein
MKKLFTFKREIGVAEIMTLGAILWVFVADHYEIKALQTEQLRQQGQLNTVVAVQQDHARAMQDLAISCHASAVEVNNFRLFVQTHFGKTPL